MKIHIGIWWGCFTALASLMAQENVPAISGMVNLPYETVRALERKQCNSMLHAVPPSLLSSAHYRIDLSTNPATIRTSMTVQNYADTWNDTPLLPESVSLSELQPTDAAIRIKDGSLQFISQEKGKRDINFRLTPSEENSLVTLPCACASLAFVGLPEGKLLECVINDVVRVLSKNGELPIPAQGARMTWRLITPTEQEALPPSRWQWRHEVAVVENNGLLVMTSHSQAETNEGDTREAELILPAGVNQIEVASESLDQQILQRIEGGSQRLLLLWKGERQLNRAVSVRYQKRVSSLQPIWILEAPRGHLEKSDLVRFHLADQPQRKFSATGLSGPFSPQSLSSAMQQELRGDAYFLIDAPLGQISLGQVMMPVASMADAVINKARWDTRIESDGASLTAGQIDVQYRSGARLTMRLPENAILLSCSADDQEIVPIIPAPGVLEMVLPRHQSAMTGTKVLLSYTERLEKVAALEGQISLKLPHTSYLIHGMQWQVTLPVDYSAEIAGNMTRPTTLNSAPNVILLEKNLCRDETPQTEIFYNRHNNSHR